MRFHFGHKTTVQCRTMSFVFTGVVQHAGRVVAIEPAPIGRTLVIDPLGWSHHPKPGDSIAVNGCCLTLTHSSTQNSWRFDVVSQTLQATNLGALATDDHVNLEHPVTPHSFLDGHIVQGHIDGVGIVEQVQNAAGDFRLRMRVPAGLEQFIVDRGSIAVNGVSLTVAAVGADWFEVALIPTTLRLTNLGDLRQGDRVNLEADYIAKIVARMIKPGDV